MEAAVEERLAGTRSEVGLEVEAAEFETRPLLERRKKKRLVRRARR